MPDPDTFKREQGAAALLADASPQQLASVNDPRDQVAVLGTRRCGKTRTWIRKLLDFACTTPNTHQIYCNTTRGEIKRLAWRGANPKDGLEYLNESLGLGGITNRQDLTFTFPNGSVIECIPADDERAIGKMLGTAPHRVWIDEAQKMPHIQGMIENTLGPAMLDFGGQLVLTGTPSKHCFGYYYEVTKRAGGVDDEDVAPYADGWSVHTFNVLDNPHFGTDRDSRYSRVIEREMKKRGWIGGEAALLREYYGRWVREDAMYAYDVHRVPEDQLLYAPARLTPDGWFDLDAAIADLPSIGDWNYGFSADLGYFPDPFAFVIWAWSFNSPILYELMSWERDKVIPDGQGEIMTEIYNKLNPAYMVADADGAGGVVKGWQAGWHDRLPLPIEPAEKSQKETAREWFNNDLRTGMMKLRKDGVLYKQLRRLPLRTLPNGKITEDQRRDGEGKRKFPNDAADAALYGHRAAQHHRFTEPTPEPVYDTPEYWAKVEADLEQAAQDELEEESWI